jgi:glycosyltransferase involved in cell wall biosynthesis
MTVGRLIDLKNPMSVLQAFRQIQAQEDRLVFIGDGYLREALLSKSRALGLAAQVEVTGVISRDKVYQEMLGADVFISASYGEGLPVAVLEAMACRRPVLLSDIAPHREIARGADFIPLIPPGNTAAFAQEIKRFKHMSASQRAEIGERCRKLVEARFSLVDMYRGYNRIYSRVIGGENR